VNITRTFTRVGLRVRPVSYLGARLPHHLTRVVATLGLAGFVAFAAACGSSSSNGPAAANGDAKVTIEKAWARTSPSSVTAGAAYATITAAQDDALTGVEVDAAIAKTAEIHETVASTGSMGSDTTMMGGAATTMMSSDSAPAAMTMQPVDKIDLKAGTAVTLAPGGYHIMLMDLAKPLVAGDTFTLELVFEKAGTQAVTFTVRDDAP